MLFENAATINPVVTPTFAGNVAGIGDLFPQLVLPSMTTAYQADAEALKSDWAAVGQDLSTAIRQYARSIATACKK